MSKRIVVVLAGLAFMSACGSGAGVTAAKLASAAADQICACGDAACAQAALDDYSKKATALMQTIKPEEVTPEDMQAIKAAAEKWMQCQADLAAKAASVAAAAGAVKLASDAADQICACEDAACAQTALDAYTETAAALTKAIKPEDAKPEDAQKIKDATDRGTKCQADLTAKAAVAAAAAAVKLASDAADQVCACVDVACAQAAVDAYTTKAGELMAAVKPEDAKPEDAQKIKDATGRWTKCQADLAAKAGGGTEDK